jgi:hypothetical protein
MSVIEPDENELGDGLADLERRRHSAGVQRGLRVAAERGFYILPREPYGYRKIVVSDRGTTRSKLEPDPQTVGTVRTIFDARLQGTTQQEIAQQLNGSGIPSPTRNQWTIAQVRSILRNEVYCGTIVASRRAMNDPATAVKVPNAFPAIIPQDDFDTVQQMK